MGLLFVLGFACGKGDKPAPPEYVGAWTGDDGSTLTIRADGSGDYKNGGTTVTGGAVSVEGDKLSITFVGVGPSFKIDKAPSGNQMTLEGVVYRKGGSSDTSTDKSSSNDKSSSDDKKASGDVPSDSDLQSLVKQTLMDFNGAIQSGDFSDFHDTLSEPFQKQASPEKLAGVFHEFVENKLDFSSAKNLTATFSPTPSVEKEGSYKVLHVQGYYPTKPRKTNFNFKYIKEEGEWKLSSIEVNTKDQ
jgi:hypothetical protein